MYIRKALVHRLSHKILLNDYPHEDPNTVDVPINANDLIIGSSPYLKKALQKIDTPITIISPIKLKDDVGHVLFYFHKQKCFEYMLNGLDHNTPASQSLDNWYNIYELDDDDYDRDTMYREWTRFYKRLNAPKKQNKPKPKKYKAIPSVAQIDEWAQKIVSQYVTLFFNVKKTWNYTLPLQLYAYIYVYYGIKPKGNMMTIYQRNRYFKHFLNQHPDVKKTIDALLLP